MSLFPFYLTPLSLHSLALAVSLLAALGFALRNGVSSSNRVFHQNFFQAYLALLLLGSLLIGVSTLQGSVLFSGLGVLAWLLANLCLALDLGLPRIQTRSARIGLLFVGLAALAGVAAVIQGSTLTQWLLLGLSQASLLVLAWGRPWVVWAVGLGLLPVLAEWLVGEQTLTVNAADWLGVLRTLTMTAMAWLLLRTRPQRTSYVVGMLGLMLVAYLAFFLPSVQSQLDNLQNDLAVQRRQSSLLVYQSLLSGRVMAPYPEVAYLAAWTQNPAAASVVYLRPGLETPVEQLADVLEISVAEDGLAADFFSNAIQIGPSESAVSDLSDWPLLPRSTVSSSGTDGLTCFACSTYPYPFQAHLFYFGEDVYEVGYLVEDDVRAVHNRVLSLLSSGLFGMVVLFGLFPLIFQATLLDPLQRLAKAARQVAGGNLDVHLPEEDPEKSKFLPVSQDEIGLLSHDFNQMTAALKARTTELAKANQRIQHEVDERQRLARALHDSVTQSVYGLALLARGARETAEQAEGFPGQEPSLASQLDMLEADSLNALRELRLLIYELRPLALQETGLLDALRERLEVVERRAGLQVTLDTPDEIALTPDAEIELYYLAIEALNNVVKHAAASQVSVRLETLKETLFLPPLLRLEISDNGCGFNPLTQPQGFGLRSMHERAAALGATLEIHSAPGQGTTVRVIYSHT